ncbi:MAG: carboxypeptidase regulatory-like domain-containing protein [Chloroflexi bacterium]|nr:carboxypeptidase regulatory-like domain-containing protein [Chloroflexota bacterium]
MGKVALRLVLVLVVLAATLVGGLSRPRETTALTPEQADTLIKVQALLYALDKSLDAADWETQSLRLLDVISGVRALANSNLKLLQGEAKALGDLLGQMDPLDKKLASAALSIDDNVRSLQLVFDKLPAEARSALASPHSLERLGFDPLMSSQVSNGVKYLTDKGLPAGRKVDLKYMVTVSDSLQNFLSGYKDTIAQKLNVDPKVLGSFQQAAADVQKVGSEGQQLLQDAARFGQQVQKAGGPSAGSFRTMAEVDTYLDAATKQLAGTRSALQEGAEELTHQLHVIDQYEQGIRTGGAKGLELSQRLGLLVTGATALLGTIKAAIEFRQGQSDQGWDTIRQTYGSVAVDLLLLRLAQVGSAAVSATMSGVALAAIMGEQAAEWVVKAPERDMQQLNQMFGTLYGGQPETIYGYAQQGSDPTLGGRYFPNHPLYTPGYSSDPQLFARYKELFNAEMQAHGGDGRATVNALLKDTPDVSTNGAWNLPRDYVRLIKFAMDKWKMDPQTAMRVPDSMMNSQRKMDDEALKQKLKAMEKQLYQIAQSEEEAKDAVKPGIDKIPPPFSTSEGSGKKGDHPDDNLDLSSGNLRTAKASPLDAFTLALAQRPEKFPLLMDLSLVYKTVTEKAPASAGQQLVPRPTVQGRPDRLPTATTARQPGPIPTAVATRIPGPTVRGRPERLAPTVQDLPERVSPTPTAIARQEGTGTEKPSAVPLGARTPTEFPDWYGGCRYEAPRVISCSGNWEWDAARGGAVRKRSPMDQRLQLDQMFDPEALYMARRQLGAMVDNYDTISENMDSAAIARAESAKYKVNLDVQVEDINGQPKRVKTSYEAPFYPVSAYKDQPWVLRQNLQGMLSHLDDIAGVPQVAILRRGDYEPLMHLLMASGVMVALVDTRSTAQELSRYPVLIAPTGSLSGTVATVPTTPQALARMLGRPEVVGAPASAGTTSVQGAPAGAQVGNASSSFRTALERYVAGGGRLISFTQKRGADYASLPGGEVIGFGFEEDQECQFQSSYIATYHPFLASQTSARPSFNVDGYFTSFPEGTQVILRRATTDQPAMVLYPFGRGTVLASVLYSDWAYTHNQITSDEQALLRDLVAWAVNPALFGPGGERSVGERIALPVKVMNPTDRPGAQVVFHVVGPQGTVVEDVTVAAAVAPGATREVDLAYTVPQGKEGLYRVDYALKDAQEDILFNTFNAAGFSASRYRQNPEGFVHQGQAVTFSLQSDRETYPLGGEGRFSVIVFNNSDAPRRVKVAYRFPHNSWNAPDPARYKGELVLTVPPQGKASQDLTITVVNKDGIDRLWADFYDADTGQSLGSTSKGFYTVLPKLDVKASVDNAEYQEGQAVQVSLSVLNRQARAYTATLSLLLTDSAGRVVASGAQEAEVPAEGTALATSTLPLPDTALSGQYQVTVLAEAADDTVGSTTTSTFNYTAGKGTLRGTVLNLADKKPVANASLNFHAGALRFTAKTDAAGAYSIEMPGANYVTEIIALSFYRITGLATLPPHKDGAKDFFPAPIGSGMIPPGYGLVRGRVLSHTEETPVLGADVLLKASESDVFTPTDARGNYEVVAPAGDYTATVRSGGLEVMSPVPMAVMEGQRLEQPLFVRLGALSGRVLSLVDGLPVAAARVTVDAGYFLTGGPSFSTPISADDNIQVSLNGQSLFVSTGDAGPKGPVDFVARAKDQLKVEAVDSKGNCRSLGPVWLVNPVTGKSQQLTAGKNEGCQNFPAGVTFFNETFSIPEDSLDAQQTTTTAPDGTFRATQLFEGVHVLLVSAPGFRPATVRAYTSAGESSVTVYLESIATTLGGQVLDLITGGPVAGANVEFAPESEVERASTTTDAQGLFSFRVPASQSLRKVRVSQAGYGTVEVSTLPAPVAGSDPAKKSGNFVPVFLEATVRAVSGRVLRLDNDQPVVGATLVFDDGVTRAATDAQGRYNLGLANGFHKVALSAPGFQDLASGLHVTQRALGQDFYLAPQDFRPPTSTGTLRATVLDLVTDQPIKDVWTDMLDDRPGGVNTRAEGVAAIGTEAGTWGLLVRKDGYQTLQFPKWVTVYPDRTTEVAVYLRPTQGTLSARIYDVISGQPVKDVWTDMLDDRPGGVNTSAGGVAAIGTEAATWGLLVRKDGYQTLQFPKWVTVYPGRTTEMAVYLRPTQGMLSARIYDVISGQPVKDVWTDMLDDRPGGVNTSAEGVAAIGTEAGTWGLLVRKDGYQTLQFPKWVTVYPGRTTEMAFGLWPSQAGAGTVSGRLGDASGQTVTGATLRVDGKPVTLGPDGAFKAQLAAGQHRLRAEAPGMTPVERAVVVFAGKTQRLDLALASSTPGTVSFLAQVKDSQTGQAVAGARVWLTPTAGKGAPVEATTDARGQATLQVQAVAQLMRVSAQGYQELQQPVDRIPALGAGQLLLLEPLSALPQPRPAKFLLMAQPPAEALRWQAGQPVSLRFTVQNTGEALGQAQARFDVPGLFKEARDLHLAPGARQELGYDFALPEDLDPLQDIAELTVGDARYELPFTIDGIRISMEAELDKQFYREGEKAVLTLRVRNEGRQAVPLEARVQLAQWLEQRPFKLDGGTDTTVKFEVPVQFTGDKLLFSVYHASGRSLYINAYYLHSQTDVLSLATNAQQYRVGQEAIITLQAERSGTLTLIPPPGWKGLDTTPRPINQGAQKLSFTIPPEITGTHLLGYTFQTDAGYFGGALPIDVDGYKVKVADSRLDRPLYTSQDSVAGTLRLEASRPMSAAISGQVYDSQGRAVGSRDVQVSLEAGRNDVVLEVPFASAAAGEHTLDYSISTDLPGHSLVQMAAATQFFEVWDTTSPSVVSTRPVLGSRGASPSGVLEFTFSEAMYRLSTEKALTITPAVTGTMVWTANTMTFMPDQDLAPNTEYTVSVDEEARDLAGNPLEAFQLSFTTGAVKKQTQPGGGLPVAVIVGVVALVALLAAGALAWRTRWAASRSQPPKQRERMNS